MPTNLFLSEPLLAPAFGEKGLEALYNAVQVWNIATGAAMQRIERSGGDGNGAQSATAISAIHEYQGTHFITSALDGMIRIYEFCKSPSPTSVVEPVPIATYAPPAAPSSFGGTPVIPPVLACAISSGPISSAQGVNAWAHIFALVIAGDVPSLLRELHVASCLPSHLVQYPMHGV